MYKRHLWQSTVIFTSGKNMEYTIMKVFSVEIFTKENPIALVNSYSSFSTSDVVIQIDPHKLDSCGECLEVDLKFRLKVQESITNSLQSLKM